MDSETEDEIVERVGHFAYGLLIRLRIRDQAAPAKAADFVTSKDRNAAVNNALRALEQAGLLTRESSMTAKRGKEVHYRTHVENDPLQRDE